MFSKGDVVAEVDSRIYNKMATEKLNGPEELDCYVRVAKPGVWMLLVACALLIGGLMMWGLFGTVYVNVSSTGVRIGDKVCCYLSGENTSHVRVGNESSVCDVPLRIASISEIPLSADEVKEIVKSDYLLSQLVDDAWVYEITFEGDGADGLQEGIPLTVSIAVDQVTPLEMAFGVKK